MAKTVTIPSNMQPNWECEINGIKYSYPAGTEQNVPDSVADLIANSEADKPREGSGYRLINQVKLTEEVGLVEFSKDLYGRPFNLKYVRAVLYAPGSNTGVFKEKPSSSLFSSLYLNDEKTVVAQISSSSNVAYEELFSEVKHPHVSGYSAYRFGTTYTSANKAAMSTSYRGLVSVDFNRINKVKIDAGVDFSEGCIIELWGE